MLISSCAGPSAHSIFRISYFHLRRGCKCRAITATASGHYSGDKRRADESLNRTAEFRARYSRDLNSVQ